MSQRAMGWCARVIAAMFGAVLQLGGAQAQAQAAAPPVGTAPSKGSSALAAVTGEVTRIRGAHIKGWACDAAAPAAALQVRILDGNGSVLASAVANEPQTGLDRHEAACGSDRHGFTIDLPKASFSCAAQALAVAAVPAAGGAPVALAGSGAQSGAMSRPPAGRITVSVQGGGANPPLSATFTPDPDGGSLARVRWLDGGTVIGDTTKAPHTIRWTPRRAGALDIHAITTDGCGVNNHVTASHVPAAGFADARPPLVSFADPGPGRSYFTLGNLPLRMRITRQSSPLAQVRLYYATSADDPAAPYQPLTAMAAPGAGAYLGSWALPRPAPGTPWDGRYVLLAEAEDAAGRVGAARIELPVALPTYGQATAPTFGVGDRTNNNVPLTALFIVAGQGENAAPEAAGADLNSNSHLDADVEMDVVPGAAQGADRAGAGSGGADGGVALKALYSVNVTVVGGGTVSATVPAGKSTTAKFTHCANSCNANFDTNGNGSTDLTLTATPGTGNVFTGWLGAPCTGRSTCRFTVSGSSAITAIFAPAAMAPGGILPVTLDIDANLAQDALTDALLTIRYLFGLGETSIVNGALGAGAQRGGAGQPTVSGYLGAIRPVLDVDGNGVADALTDGLLINRYQFGLRGASLIAGAIGANAQRTTAAQIESYLASPCGAGVAFGAVASNAVIAQGTAVALSATVTPTTLCPVDSVQYTFAGATGSTVIGTGTTGPNFGAQWNTAGVANGTYALKATARYGAFPVAAASATNVRINTAPSIALLAPAAGYAYGYGAAQPPAVPLRIAVADPDGVPANGVTLRLNGAAQALTSLGGGQWQATTAPLAPGNYTVAATATDSLGTAATVWFGAGGPGTAPPTFTVKNTNGAPAVALSASAANVDVGGTVTFTATAQDADGWVAQATFATARNGVAGWISNATNATKANPWSPAPTASWTPAQPGTYTASVTATDNVGGTAVSAPLTIVVAQVVVNSPPTIVSVVPAQQQVLQGGTATITVIARDPDGDPLTLQLLNGAAPLAGVTVVRLNPYAPAGDNTYVLTWDTAAVAPQAYPSLVVKATDNGAAGGSATRSVAVTVIAAPASATPAADLVYPGVYATPAIGTAPGSLSITDSGAATYSMPIQVAPGVASMQPQLALNYSSQGGNGLLGPGWSLSGLSVITRCAQTEAQDGSKEGINYDGLAANDRYCLDGQRLIPVGAPVPVTDGGVQARRIEYRTEIESYSRIESYQEVLPNHLIGPYRFRVLTRSGQQLDYGARWWIISRGYLQTLDTQGLVNRSNTAKLWALDRVSDRHGNYLTIDYDDGDGDDSGAASPVVLASFSAGTSSLASLPAPFGAFPAVQHWPTRIRYYGSGVAENTAGRFNEACFQYDVPAGAQAFFDAGAGQGALTRRLRTIRTQADVTDAGRVACGNGSAVGTWNLDYEASPTAAGTSRLTAVRQCGADGVCLPATTFQWNDAPKSWSAPTDAGGNPVTSTTIVSDRFHAVDVNGDGRTDLIAQTSHNAGSGAAHVCLADHRGAWSCANWGYSYPPSAYDANNDELYADVNGDGRVDLLVINANNGIVIACPANAQGSGFDPCATTSGIPPRSDKVRLQADLNGDGRIDLLFYNNDRTWDACLARADATFVCQAAVPGPNGEFDGTAEHVLPGDFNGDGRADLAQRQLTDENNDQWKICFSSFATPGAPANGFDCPAATAWTQGISGPLYKAAILDFNGDGLADMAYRAFAGQWRVCLSTGDGAFQRRSDDPASPDYGRRCRTWNGIDAETEDTLFGDFNGDGRSDMATYTGSGQFRVCLSTGTDFSCENWGSSVPVSDTDRKFMIGDLNGDGRTDILHRRSNSATWSVGITQRAGDQIVRILNGLGAATQLAYAPLTDPAVYARGAGASAAAREIDIQSPLYVVRQTQADNGIGGLFTTSYFYEELTGRTDGRGLHGFKKRRLRDDSGIVTEAEYQRVPAASYAAQWPVVGRPVVERRYAPTTLPPYAANIADRVSFNGGQALFGGQLRLVARTTTTWAVRDSATCGAAGGVVCASVDNAQLVAKQVHATQTVKESWEPGTVQTAGAALPTMTTSSPLAAIDAFGNPLQSSLDPGDGYAKQTVNTYSNDTANWLLGRLLRAQVTSNGPTAALTRKSAFGYHGVAGVACAGGVTGVLCSETIEPDEETKPISSLENGQPLALLWQRTAYTYDQYGNRVTTTVSYKDRAADAAAYNVALVDRSRKSITCYDTNANAPASDCFEASGARQSYGRFPLLARNAAGHSEARTFDSRLGVPLTVRGPNGMLTTSAYDGFGRKFLETATDSAGNRLNQSYSALEGVNAVARCAASTAPNCLRTFEQYRMRTVQSGGGASHVYHDTLQRELRRESKAFASGTWVDTGADYDALGRRQNLKRPAANGVVTTTLAYDTIGRVVKEAPDAGGVVCTRYNGLSVTTTRHPDPGLDCQTGTGGANPLGTPINATSAPAARNQAATRTQNGRGQLVQANDAAGGVTMYRYDAHDNLLQVTPLASSTLSELLAYDRRGRKLSLNSPDSGNWTYEYNGAGELVRQTDGKGQVIRHYYDSLGRMIERREHPGSESTLPFVTVWTHDAHAGDAPGAGACNRSLGKLCEVRSNSVNRGGVTPGTLLPLTHGGVTLPVQRRSFHDDHGRVRQAVTTLAEPGGSRTYASRSAFDANGRVDTLTYPSGYAIRHRYAAWTGQLDQVSETAGAVVHWQASSRYKDGQIATMLVGGATTTRNYDAFGRLAGIATSAAGVAIQGASYVFDRVGNLTRRYDPAAGQADQYYGYDVLNRLSAAAATAAGLANAANAIAQYDATGNLTWKSGTGYFGYVPGTHRLCATAAAANPACAGSQYVHDGNGNATLWNGRSLAYTPFNSPAQIADTINGATLAYQHDAGHARIKELSTVNGLTYYLGAYEEHTRQADSVLEQRHYVHTPEGIAGVVTLRSAPAGLPALPPEQAKSLRYWHKDHLGSVVVITAEAGALKQTFTYDPWGQRTNAGLATGEPYAEERGYTGHEHLTEVRLIHMNGRVFDPAAGRFLQADPVVQEATSSQNYNRYAYVLNNPLSLTDPSGHNWLSKFIHKSTAQMQFLHGDLAGGWLTRKYADRAAANPYVRMVGAAVAAYYTFGAVGGYLEGAALEAGGSSVFAAVPDLQYGATVATLTPTGSATAGAAGGFAAGGIQGGNIESAVYGAVSAGLSGGISGYYGSSYPVERVAANSVAGGISSVIHGGAFIDGFKSASFTSLLTYSNVQMRNEMIAQSKLDVRNDGVGWSSGMLGDGYKLGGGRFDELIKGSCSLLGCHQSGPGAIVGLGYRSGSFTDMVVESFAGPHDRANSMWWYDALGNIRQDLAMMQRTFLDLTTNYSTSLLFASPFAVAAIREQTYYGSYTQGRR